jgi:hypothetical protein
MVSLCEAIVKICFLVIAAAFVIGVFLLLPDLADQIVSEAYAVIF